MEGRQKGRSSRPPPLTAEGNEFKPDNPSWEDEREHGWQSPSVNEGQDAPAPAPGLSSETTPRLFGAAGGPQGSKRLTASMSFGSADYNLHHATEKVPGSLDALREAWPLTLGSPVEGGPAGAGPREQEAGRAERRRSEGTPSAAEMEGGSGQSSPYSSPQMSLERLGDKGPLGSVFNLDSYRPPDGRSMVTGFGSVEVVPPRDGQPSDLGPLRGPSDLARETIEEGEARNELGSDEQVEPASLGRGAASAPDRSGSGPGRPPRSPHSSSERPSAGTRGGGVGGAARVPPASARVLLPGRGSLSDRSLDRSPPDSGVSTPVPSLSSSERTIDRPRVWGATIPRADASGRAFSMSSIGEVLQRMKLSRASADGPVPPAGRRPEPGRGMPNQSSEDAWAAGWGDPGRELVVTPGAGGGGNGSPNGSSCSTPTSQRDLSPRSSGRRGSIPSVGHGSALGEFDMTRPGRSGASSQGVGGHHFLLERSLSTDVSMLASDGSAEAARPLLSGDRTPPHPGGGGRRDSNDRARKVLIQRPVARRSRGSTTLERAGSFNPVQQAYHARLSSTSTHSLRRSSWVGAVNLAIQQGPAGLGRPTISTERQQRASTRSSSFNQAHLAGIDPDAASSLSAEERAGLSAGGSSLKRVSSSRSMQAIPHEGGGEDGAPSSSAATTPQSVGREEWGGARAGAAAPASSAMGSPGGPRADGGGGGVSDLDPHSSREEQLEAEEAEAAGVAGGSAHGQGVLGGGGAVTSEAGEAVDTVEGGMPGDSSRGGGSFVANVLGLSRKPSENKYDFHLDDLLVDASAAAATVSPGGRRGSFVMRKVERKGSAASGLTGADGPGGEYPGEEVEMLHPCHPVALWHTVILPHWRWYRRWYYWTILLVVYSAVIAPLRFAFLTDRDAGGGKFSARRNRSTELEIVDYCIDAMFLVDMILTGHLAYKDERQAELVTDPYRILLHYVRSLQFYMDLMATVPFDALYLLIAGEDDERVGYLGLFRLVRLNRLFKAFAEEEEKTRFNYRQVRITKFVCIVLGVGHFVGCLMWFLAANDEFSESTWVGQGAPELIEETWFAQYVRSVYWAVTTLTTVGYGDLSPGNNNEELLLTMLYMVFNMGLSAYILGNMTVLLTSADQSVAEYRAGMKALELFMSRNKLPPDLCRQMRAYATLQHQLRENNDQILTDFPPLIRTRVVRYMHMENIERTYLIGDTGPHFLDVLLSSMRVDQVTDDTWLIQQWDIPDELYFLTDGGALVVMSDHDVTDEVDEAAVESYTDIWAVGEASVVGEQAFLVRTAHLYGVKTTGQCSLLVLERTDWDRISIQFPDEVKTIATNVLTHTQLMYDGVQSAVHDMREQAVAKEAESDSWYAEKAALLDRQLERVANRPREDVPVARPTSLPPRAGMIAIMHEVSNGADLEPKLILEAKRKLEAWRTREVKRAAIARKLLRLKEKGVEVLRAYVAQLQAHVRSMEARVSEKVIACVRADDVGELDRLWASLEPQGGFDLNGVDSEGRSALHVACSLGRVASVRWLAERGAATDVMDPEGRTPLLVAVRGRHDAIVRTLRDYGAQLGMTMRHPFAPGSAQGILARVLAGGMGDSAAVRITATGAREAPSGGTEMVRCAQRGNQGGLRRLLMAGMSPSEPDAEGRTALHVGAAQGHAGIVQLLLAAGADPNTCDQAGRTPLLEAVHGGHDRCCELLSAVGAELGLLEADWRAFEFRVPEAVRGKGGWAVRAASVYRELVGAVAADDDALLRRLLDAGAEPCATNLDGRTALHACCQAGKYGAAFLLVQAGGDLDQPCRWGNTPVHDAAEAGHGDMEAVLRKVPVRRRPSPAAMREARRAEGGGAFDRSSRAGSVAGSVTGVPEDIDAWRPRPQDLQLQLSRSSSREDLRQGPPEGGRGGAAWAGAGPGAGAEGTGAPGGS